MALLRSTAATAILLFTIASAAADPIAISADDLAAEYGRSRSGANAKYKGKDLVVFGHFGETSGKRVVYFLDRVVICEMSDAKTSTEGLSSGDYMVVSGVGGGHTFGTPSVRMCRLLDESSPDYVPEEEAHSAVSQQAPIIVSASDLDAEYAKSKIQANEKYRGRVLVVFGYLNTGDDDMLHFRGKSYCSMRGGQSAEDVPQGSYVVVEGVGDGHFLGAPSIRTCSLLDDSDPGFVPEGEGPVLASEPSPPDPEPASSADREPEPEPPKQEAASEEEPPLRPAADKWSPLSYQLLETKDISSSNRTRHRVTIHVPDAGHDEQRIATAMQAALDAHRQVGGSEYVQVMVHSGPEQWASLQARLGMAPDGCGVSGTDCSGEVWSVSGSDVVIPQSVISRMALSEDDAAAAEDAACRSDLQCLGDKYSLKAASYCKDHIQNLSDYAHKWTDGLFGAKFPMFGWQSKANGIVRYHGDSIQFQNAFGAWVNHKYWCDYDTVNERPIRVGAEPGRL